jgi:hypothetical protein
MTEQQQTADPSRARPLIETLTRMEDALVELAGWYADYRAALQREGREAYQRGGHSRVSDLQHAIGLGRVAAFLAARMQALGLADVLNEARTTVVASDTWATDFADRVRAAMEMAAAPRPTPAPDDFRAMLPAVPDTTEARAEHQRLVDAARRAAEVA